MSGRAGSGKTSGLRLEQAEADLAETLHMCRISGAEKLASAVASDTKKLIRRAELELKDLRSRRRATPQPFPIARDCVRSTREAPKWLFVEETEGLLEFRPAVAVVPPPGSPTENGLDAARSSLQHSCPVPRRHGVRAG